MKFRIPQSRNKRPRVKENDKIEELKTNDPCLYSILFIECKFHFSFNSIQHACFLHFNLSQSIFTEISKTIELCVCV